MLKHSVQDCVQLPMYADNVAVPAFIRRCSSNLLNPVCTGATAAHQMEELDGRPTVA